MARNARFVAFVVLGVVASPALVRATDTEADGIADGLDVCCNTPPGIVVDAQGRPRADLDLDCDVDTDDFAEFAACANGTAIPYPTGCDTSDFDGDGDVDLNDYGLIQRSLTGPMNCANQLCKGVASNCHCQADSGTITCGVGACQRTVAVCANGQPNTCTPGSPTAETCNGSDDNCNGQIDDGFNLQTDVNNCGSCWHACTNAHGTTACTAGACNPGCSFGWESCDANLDNGCEVSLLTNNSCAAATNVGTVSGDVGSDSLTFFGFAESWLRVFVSENNNLPFPCMYLSATITLTPPAGINYDLYAYCDGCTTVAASSTLGTGQVDQVNLRWDEACSGGVATRSDSGRYVYIEVRYFSGQACGNYMLQVVGNTTVGTNTCPTK